MKYFHCATFFNETSLLKLLCETIKELDPIIVLVEATTTHTGDPKPLYFEENKHLFAEYNIRHYIVDLPNTGDAWVAENFQRDCLTKGLYDAEDGDWIFVGDLDEIPNPERIKLFKPHMGIAGLKMTKFSYYLNCVECYQCWERAKLTTWKILKQTTPNKLRNDDFQYIIEHSGWHFAWLGGVEKMLTKMFAYAHTESVAGDIVDPDVLRRKYETGESMWGTDFWRFVKIDDSFPKYLQEHQEEFQEYIKKI